MWASWNMNMRAMTFYFIDNESYFWGDRPYGDWYYDLEKFSFFCKAALSSLPVIGFKPDVIHCHDWQTGLIPVHLKDKFHERRVFPGYQVRHDDPQPEIPGCVGCEDNPAISLSCRTTILHRISWKLTKTAIC